MRPALLLLLCLIAPLGACMKPPSGAAAANGGAPAAAAKPASAAARHYAGTLPFQGTVYNLGCKAEVPVAGSLAITVELDDTPTFEAIGSRTFGPACFSHTDQLSLKGKLTKIAEGQYRYQRDSKNDTVEILVTEAAGAAAVTYDNAHHCCGKPNEGNEGDQSGSAVLDAVE
jgi:hypothetical protein